MMRTKQFRIDGPAPRPIPGWRRGYLVWHSALHRTIAVLRTKRAAMRAVRAFERDIPPDCGSADSLERHCHLILRRLFGPDDREA